MEQEERVQNRNAENSRISYLLIQLNEQITDPRANARGIPSESSLGSARPSGVFPPLLSACCPAGAGGGPVHPRPKARG